MGFAYDYDGEWEEEEEENANKPVDLEALRRQLTDSRPPTAFCHNRSSNE